MAEISLVVDAGRTHGPAASRRLRAAGQIPAIIYGHGMEPIAVSVDGRALRSALTTESGTNALLRIEIGDTHHLALAREIQRHPVRHTVTHVDFQIVRRDEIIQSDVSISLVGDTTAIHRADGTIDQELFSLPVKAKPADLPSHLEFDISTLGIGDIVRVSELELPDGVATDVDPDTVVAAVHAMRVAAEGEGAEGAEGEAEGGEGEAASDGGGSSDAKAAAGSSEG